MRMVVSAIRQTRRRTRNTGSRSKGGEVRAVARQGPDGSVGIQKSQDFGIEVTAPMLSECTFVEWVPDLALRRDFHEDRL